jgi:hypothetical protein
MVVHPAAAAAGLGLIVLVAALPSLAATAQPAK